MTNTLHTLIDQLNHPDRNLRSNAALSLGNLSERGALEALLSALCFEPEILVREDITWALVRVGDAAVQPLIGLLKHSDSQVRHHAAHVLGKIRDTRAIDALTTALSDEDAAVVLKSAFSLSQMGAVTAIPALIARLGHPNSEVRTTLVKVLEGFGAPAVPLLLESLKHPRWQVREQAVDILGQIGDSEHFADVRGLLVDEEWEVRFSAVNAIAHLGNKATIAAALQPMLTDKDSRVGTLAGEIISRLKQVRKPKMPSI